MKQNIQKAFIFILCIALAVMSVACATEGGDQPDVSQDPNIRHYATEWSYNETSHWHACTDAGYTDLRIDEGTHTFSEEILTEATYTEKGRAKYTCSVCGYSYEADLGLKVDITELPSVTLKNMYIGQPLSTIPLTGGSGSVEGDFSWTNPKETLTASGSYSITFTPKDSTYGKVTASLSLVAEQLTITVTAGEEGVVTPSGTTNVNYGESLQVTAMPNLGYAVSKLVLDGKEIDAASLYTFENITQSHTLAVSFAESDAALSISCVSGTAGCYSITGNTVTFSGVKADSVYAISGEMVGNIVISVDDAYKFDLELCGLSLSSQDASPISILSGDKVTISAKNGTSNAIYDLREAVPEEDDAQSPGAIYSAVDLDIEGKGSLIIKSENNNGIHCKDDLDVKNLTLSVTCVDNALKGNDSVTVTGGTIALIATGGDGIKTSATDISDKGNQRGTITLSNTNMTIHAACDGMDAAYNAVVEGKTTLDIFTSKYSEHAGEVSSSDSSSDASKDQYYIRFTSKDYNYAVRYYNSDSDTLWVSATYHSTASGNRNNYYYYSFPKHTNYSKMQFFIFESSVTPSQANESKALVSSDYLSINTEYDTFALTNSYNGLYYEWTNYTTSVQDSGMGGFGGPGGGGPGGHGGGGPGGMNEGNSDKSTYSAKGIKAGNEILISGGTISVKAYDDAIHANADSTLENGATPTGNVTISGGTLTLYSSDDGIHADGALTVSAGTVNITKCYEGLEGTTITVAGGNVSVVSSDDGMNATTTSGTAITISGGTVYVYAGGDGLDSNSRTSYSGIVFNGGNTVVICTSNANSALDTESGYQYKSGSVVAITPNGGMGSSETQHCSNFSSVASKSTLSMSSGEYLTVTVSGKVVATVKAPCRLSSMVVYLGSTSANFTTSSSTSVGLDSNGVRWEK